MDQAEINNWKSIAESMEAKRNTNSWFYIRARAIADGKPDPMPNISELLANSAWSLLQGKWDLLSGFDSTLSIL